MCAAHPGTAVPQCGQFLQAKRLRVCFKTGGTPVLKQTLIIYSSPPARRTLTLPCSAFRAVKNRAQWDFSMIQRGTASINCAKSAPWNHVPTVGRDSGFLRKDGSDTRKSCNVMVSEKCQDCALSLWSANKIPCNYFDISGKALIYCTNRIL